MQPKRMRWKLAAAIAFLMGVPFVEQAQAQNVGDIVYAAVGLAAAIVGAAGNS